MRFTVTVSLLAGIVVTALLAAGAFATLELPVRDLALRALPDEPAAATAIIAIDEQSLRARGPWPWPRARLAEIVARCGAAGARAVVLDILLSDPRADDAQLAAAMRNTQTFAVSVLVENGQWLVPAPALLGSAHVAHGNFELDHDGILRRFASTKQDGTRAHTALSLEAASLVRTVLVPVGQTIAPAFRTAPRSIPVVRADDLLAGRVPPSTLRGRIVFVGPTALGLGDRVLTPVSRSRTADPGVTVHAAATESLIRGERVVAAPPFAGGIFTIAIVASLLACRTCRRSARVLLLLLWSGVIVLGGGTLLATAGIALPFLTLLLTLTLTTAAIESSALAESLRRSDVALADQREHDLASKRLLAHELRTPIASMRNLTQLLAAFDLNEGERKRVATLLQSEAGKLESMVEGLLALERLPLRDFATTSHVVDLTALVTSRVETLRTATARTLSLAADTQVHVRGDALLLERLVDNLVTNAFKYTPDDAAIEVALARDGESVVLSVTDHGPGIAPADLERIFDRFYRGATASGTDGLGLGLAFVSEIAKWHHGAVTAENAPEGGARFRVTVPLASEES